jgi:hypothetical protein
VFSWPVAADTLGDVMIVDHSPDRLLLYRIAAQATSASSGNPPSSILHLVATAVKEIPPIKIIAQRSRTMKTLSKTWEKLFAAITFAEAGEFETARGIMRASEREQKRDTQVARKSIRLYAPGANRR